MKKCIIISILFITMINIAAHVENRRVHHYRNQPPLRTGTQSTLVELHYNTQSALDEALHEAHEDLEHAAKSTVRNAMVRPILDGIYSLGRTLRDKIVPPTAPTKPKSAPVYNVLDLDGFELPAPTSVKSK